MNQTLDIEFGKMKDKNTLAKSEVNFYSIIFNWRSLFNKKNYFCGK